MMSNNIIWIAGAKGRLGQELEMVLSVPGNTVLISDLDVDITCLEDVLNFAMMNRPDYIINCAGMTDVKACEENEVMAYKVNALGARNLSTAARQVNAVIIQMSTDDVFAGDSETPVNEFDTALPVSVYGKSKLAGEKFVESLNPKHVIVRSSWVYGHSDNDFVSKIISMAKNNQPIELPVNQIGSPTSAHALAGFIGALIGQDEFGTFHASCEGSCSRYEFAKTILDSAGLNVEITPVTYDDTSAKRPQKVVLDNLMMKMTEIYEMPAWQDELKKYMGDNR